MKVIGKPNEQPSGCPEEQLFDIEHRGRVLAVIGANTAEQALGRADAIRHIVQLPRRALLEARPHRSPAIQAPYFSGGFFVLLDSVDDSDAVCPICGR